MSTTTRNAPPPLLTADALHAALVRQAASARKVTLRRRGWNPEAIYAAGQEIGRLRNAMRAADLTEARQ